MQGQGVLFGQIAAVFGIVIAGVWGATQWTAAALGYQLRLGSPWFDFFGSPVYHPRQLFEWWFFFDAYAPQVFDTGGMIAAGSGLFAVVVAIAMSVWRSRQARMVKTYGSARWADAADVRKAGLSQPAGIFLGKYRNDYLRHEGPEHVLTFAPTRSGKGVGLVVPTLLSWPASAVIHDIKGENWQITAGRRSCFSHCLLFNPTDAQSAAYNPLLEVRRGAHEVRDVQKIPDIFVDPVITANRRTYLLELTSTERAWMASVSWDYPRNRMLALQRQAQAASAAAPVDAGLSLERIRIRIRFRFRFRYAISGSNPSWKPLRAFDDGEKVYIQFPAGIAQGELPPLFVIGAQGDGQLVNYRFRSPYYIVDRQFGAAELRLGGDKGDVVRIERTDGVARRN